MAGFTTIPKFTFMSLAIKNPFLLLPTVVLNHVVSIESVNEILMWLFAFDLASGLFASYFDWKKVTPKGKFFFRAKDTLNIPDNQKGFSSDRFKKCFIKGIIYYGFPLVVLKFQEAFLIKNFKIPFNISDSEIELTTIFLLIFCCNELFSIFWENLPRCGLNLPKVIKNFITGIKEVKEEI
jgi:hypothetical protein